VLATVPVAADAAGGVGNPCIAVAIAAVANFFRATSLAFVDGRGLRATIKREPQSLGERYKKPRLARVQALTPSPPSQQIRALLLAYDISLVAQTQLKGC
jgi:hypothetical protein